MNPEPYTGLKHRLQPRQETEVAFWLPSTCWCVATHYVLAGLPLRSFSKEAAEAERLSGSQSGMDFPGRA